MIMKTENYVIGLKGLATLLSISLDGAFKIAKSGKINDAIVMRGTKKMMFDTDLVIKLLTKSELIAKEGGKNE